MLLRVENLVTTFNTRDGKVKAVDGVSFELDQCQTLGIVGESGSGKTVTGLSILNLIRPPGQVETGKIFYRDQNLLELGQNDLQKIRGHEISMIFQEPMTSLNPVFTVGDQITEAILVHQRLSKKAARQRCLEVMTLVGIPDVEARIDYYPHQMSGGLRQRVMIAMALACNPKILIADEPTTALDVTIQAQILRLIQSLQKQLKMAMIIISHDFGVISEVADTVAVMYAGKIIEQCKTKDIFRSPSHPYSLGLQKSLPTEASVGHPLYSIPGSIRDLRSVPNRCRFYDRCEFRQNKCESQEPELGFFEDSSRKVACFYPLKEQA